MVQTGRPFQRHFERACQCAVTGAHQRRVYVKLKADRLVKRGRVKKRNRLLIIGAKTRLQLHPAEIADIRIVNADFINGVNRTVAAAVKQVEVLLVVDRLYMLLEQLRLWNAFTVCFADAVAGNRRWCRQIPAVRLAAFRIIPLWRADILRKNRIDKLAAEEHHSTGSQCRTDGALGKE